MSERSLSPTLLARALAYSVHHKPNCAVYKYGTPLGTPADRRVCNCGLREVVDDLLKAGVAPGAEVPAAAPVAGPSAHSPRPGGCGLPATVPDAEVIVGMAMKYMTPDRDGGRERFKRELERYLGMV